MENKQQTGLKRNSIDKFYTKNDIVKKCLDAIVYNIDINENDIFIEPSAGNGSFSNEMNKLFKNVLCYDIEPENNNIIKQDYLELNIDKYNNTQVHIIGNPPFGRQSSLAKKFIKKSCGFANSISFILPKSFKKDSFKKSFDLYFHLEYEFDLPNNSFYINNENNEHNVPCVFQIWVKKNNKRLIQENQKPKYFKFVKKNDNPDLSFRRVGVYAGNIDKNFMNKSEQSHYFIKLNDEINLNEFINKFNTLEFNEKNNTVGPKSISKPELINKLNKLY
jgi:predicted RNA methylase